MIIRELFSTVCDRHIKEPINVGYYCISPGIMCTFLPKYLGENKHAHCTWV